MRPRIQLVSMIAVLAALYFEAGHLGLRLAFVNASTTAVWPPTGIALAALLILGLRVWPGIFIGAFLVNVTTAGTVASSICLASGNTLEALIGFLLVSRFARGADFPERAKTFLRFVMLAGVLATAVAATIGAGTLTFFGLAPLSDFQSVWFHWWLGDAAGAILITPMIVCWHASPRLTWRRARAAEAAAFLCALVVFSQAVFGLTAPASAQYQTAFLVMPLLLWPAIRFGPRETATAAFLLALFALTGTLQGSGPFASTTPFATLISLQSFMGVVALTSMVVAASTAERVLSTEELLRSQRDLEEANARLNARCVSDPLTGVANRRGFEERLSEEIERSERHRQPLALLIVDVDRFRRHNRSLGHGGADAVLRAVAGLLRSQIRKIDHIARFGGDEFVILLPNTTPEGARITAERCRRAVAACSWDKGAVTVSIGVAVAGTERVDGAGLLAAADHALFKAKEMGRNRVAQSLAGKSRKGRSETATA
jgi:diguanylate cyclase (GGDEF)-like protein